MTAGPSADERPIESAICGYAVPPQAPFEAEVLGLRAENAMLRERLALRDQALDATPTFFIIAELLGPEPRILYCNNAVAEQNGYSRQALIGQPISTLTQWFGRNNQFTPDLLKALHAGKTFHYEDEVTRRDGSVYWLGVSIKPMYDSAGRLTHSVAVGADITAKREEIRKKQQLQDQLVDGMREHARIVGELQLAQKLESVGRLAAGIAHEINTPIQYVADSLHFLQSAYDDVNQLLDSWKCSIDIQPGSDAYPDLRVEFAELTKKYDVHYLRAEIPRAFERIFGGIERVANIVKAMKEFAHPDAEEQRSADLNQAIATTLLIASNEYRYLAKIETQFGELPQVVCNIGELNQVFLNFIVNAAHAIQDAGKDVNTGEIKISTAVDGDAAVIRISDNGCGIPDEHLSKIYDPFFTTKEVGRGTGQGLTITHSILVDKHGGEIGIRSAVGVGTEFTLRLPIGGRGTRAAA
jgi:PAS domain S-box-containing protein